MGDEPKKTEGPKIEPAVSLGALLLIAVGGRLLFNSLFLQVPSVEPVLPTALLAGMLYGSGAGALVGVIGYFLSNLFLGSIGEWTIWQGFAGLIAGYIGANTNRDNYITNTIIVTILFEVIMNVYGAGYTIDSAYFFSLITFSITHIATNIFFAAIFKTLWLKAPDE